MFLYVTCLYDTIYWKEFRISQKIKTAAAAVAPKRGGLLRWQPSAAVTWVQEVRAWREWRTAVRRTRRLRRSPAPASWWPGVRQAVGVRCRTGASSAVHPSPSRCTSTRSRRTCAPLQTAIMHIMTILSTVSIPKRLWTVDRQAGSKTCHRSFFRGYKKSKFNVVPQLHARWREHYRT